jgi:hypothetical protein
MGNGQARNDFVASGKDLIKMIHDSGEDHSEGPPANAAAEGTGLRTECATPIE